MRSRRFGPGGESRSVDRQPERGECCEYGAGNQPTEQASRKTQPHGALHLPGGRGGERPPCVGPDNVRNTEKVTMFPSFEIPEPCSSNCSYSFVSHIGRCSGA